MAARAAWTVPLLKGYLNTGCWANASGFNWSESSWRVME